LLLVKYDVIASCKSIRSKGKFDSAHDFFIRCWLLLVLAQRSCLRRSWISYRCSLCVERLLFTCSYLYSSLQ